MHSGGNASSLPLVGGAPEPTINQLSKPGRRASRFPKLDVPVTEINNPAIRSGMDNATFQPPAGASGELTGLLIIKKYLEENNLTNKTDIIVPDSAHGTNPASARMAGFNVVEVSTDIRGMVNIDDLRTLVNENTAGLMLTNPNTGGLFEENIMEISNIIHESGGLVYYDGANLNAIVGVCRPGDMGFDIVHSNLHKTFATPQ